MQTPTLTLSVQELTPHDVLLRMDGHVVGSITYDDRAGEWWVHYDGEHCKHDAHASSAMARLQYLWSQDMKRRWQAQNEKRSADGWLAHPDYAGVIVHDPDGWRNDGTPWDTPITRTEFDHRLAACTLEDRRR